MESRCGQETRLNNFYGIHGAGEMDGLRLEEFVRGGFIIIKSLNSNRDIDGHSPVFVNSFQLASDQSSFLRFRLSRSVHLRLLRFLFP